ncbi:MAG: hypothetical protein AABW81_02875, partial [Nanoarchaeota archaeon]
MKIINKEKSLDNRIGFKKQSALLLSIIFVSILIISLTSAYYIATNPQYSQYTQYKGVAFDKKMCEAGDDFLVQIAPFGCDPAVVRSDLLEEQNFPVFCQLAATKINPMIKVEAIDTVSFKGNYPKEIQGVDFYPAQAALSVKEKINNPILNNIGYVVIVLKEQKNSSAMPKYIQGNLTARIRYNIESAFGLGKAEFYLPVVDDSEWSEKKTQYSFWERRAYLKLEGIDNEVATISLLDDTREITSVSLKKGETSREISLPGIDQCIARFDLTLKSFEDPDTTARLNINGDYVELRDKEKFLDNKCTVRGILPLGAVKKVNIQCTNDNKTKETFSLMINPRITLEYDGGKVEKKVGDYLFYDESSKKYVYLAYINDDKKSGKKEDLSVYLYAIPENKGKVLSSSEIDNIGRQTKNLFSPLINLVQDTTKRALSGGEVEKIINGKEIFGKTVSVVDFALPQDITLEGDAKNYYELAIADYEKVISSYSSTKDPSEANIEQTFGERAMAEEIKLSYNMNQKNKVSEICKKFRERYPDTKYSDTLNTCSNNAKLSSLESSDKEVTVNGRVYSISLDDTNEPNIDDYNAEITVSSSSNSDSFKLGKNQVAYFNNINSNTANNMIHLTGLSDGSASVKITITNKKGETKPDEKILRENTLYTFNGYTFTLTSTNIKKVARVSINPKINKEYTDANFTFKIGIEQRAIKLSPEKTKEKIENLNKSINEWEKKSESLGKVVEGMKGACLVTGAGLMVKNFFANTGGKGIARQDVMTGIKQMCAEAVNSHKFGEDKKPVTYKKVDDCILGEASYIDSAVDARAKLIEADNAHYKKLAEGCTTSGFLGGITGERIVDDNCVKDKIFDKDGNYIGSLSENVKKCLGDNVDYKGEKIPISTLVSTNTINKNNIGVNSYRDISSAASACVDPKLKPIFVSSLNKTLIDQYVNTRESALTKSTSDELSKAGFDLPGDSYGAKDSIAGVYYGKTISGDKIVLGDGGTLNAEQMYNIQYINYQNTPYILVLDKSGLDYNIQDVYYYNGVTSDSSINKKIRVENVEQTTRNNIISKFSKFVLRDASSYSHQFKSVAGEDKSGPVVKFYETEPYKGFPALVPFDEKNGWYAATRQNLPIFGGIGTADASGKVTSLVLCNVGDNGIAEYFSGIGDDICGTINSGTGQPMNQFSGLSPSDASKFTRCAFEAVEKAAGKYSQKGG